MVRALELLRAAGAGGDRGGVVSTKIVKGAELPVVSADAHEAKAHHPVTMNSGLWVRVRHAKRVRSLAPVICWAGRGAPAGEEVSWL